MKNALCGQKVSVSIQKVRKGKAEGRLLEILEKSPKELEKPGCVHYGVCGGCTFQSLPYEEQLSMKEAQVKKLIDEVITPENEDYKFYRSNQVRDSRATAIRWSFLSEMNTRMVRLRLVCTKEAVL